MVSWLHDFQENTSQQLPRKSGALKILDWHWQVGKGEESVLNDSQSPGLENRKDCRAVSQDQSYMRKRRFGGEEQ